MNKKLFLTSVVAILVTCPAWSDTFPEYMDKGKTYANAAISSNMADTSLGSVTAQIYYNINPGYYLQKGSYTATQCPANKYCGGLEFVTINTTADQGATSCPSPFNLSAAGAKSEGDCYRNCTTSDVAHSSSVAGTVYASGGSSCDPSCATGYESIGIVGGTNFWNFMASYSHASSVSVSIQNGGVGDGSGDTCTGIGLYAKNLNKEEYNCGQTENPFYNSSLGSSYNHPLNTSNFNLSDGDWAVDFTNMEASNSSPYPFVVMGDSRCSTDTVDVSDNPVVNDNGSTCYCRVEGIKRMERSVNGDWTLNDNIIGTASKWMKYPDEIRYDSYTSRGCKNYCAQYCAMAMTASQPNLGSFHGALQALVNKYMPTEKLCVGSQYQVGFNCGKRDDGNDVGGTPGSRYATYGSSYTFPVTTVCPSYPGHVLSGWSDGTTTYSPGQEISWNIANSKTFTAQWIAGNLTFKFAPNYTGCGSTICGTDGYYLNSSVVGAYGETLMTMPNGAKAKTASRGGYTLDGWYLNPEGTSLMYYNASGVGVTAFEGAEAESAINDDDTVIFYAKWTPKEYSVTYSCGDGATGTPPTAPAKATYDANYTPAANTCSKAGYTFGGWTVSGTSDVKPAGTAFKWTYAAAKTLTATWNPNTITINWKQVLRNASNNTTGVSNGEWSSTVTYGGNIVTPKEAIVPTGMTFKGWKFTK